MPGLIGPGLLPHVVGWAGVRPPKWVEGSILLALPFALFIGLSHLWDAFKRLPRDVVVDSRGLRVVGGGQNVHRWDDLVGPFVELRHPTGRDKHQNLGVDRSVQQLVLHTAGGAVVLCDVTDRWDVASLENLAEAVRRLRRARTIAGRLSPPVVAGALRCEGCGVTMVPPSSTTQTCTSCGHSQRVPDALLARIMEARVVARSRQADIEQLFDDRRCFRARGVVIAAVGVALTLWPSVVWTLHWGASTGALGHAAAMVAMPVIPAVLSGMYCQLRVYLADRIALHSVLLDAEFFEVPAAALECGHCGAPLPTPDGPVGVCLFCSTSHVLDYRGQFAIVTILRAADAVEEALSACRRERSRWHIAARITCVAALTSLVAFALVVARARQ